MRVLFLVGRDGAHPKAGGGDVQAWVWARWLAARGDAVTYVCQSHPSLPPVDVVDGVHVNRLGTGPRLAWRALRLYRQRRASFDLIYEDPIGAGRLPYFSPLFARVPVVAVWHQVSTELFRTLHSEAVTLAFRLAEQAISRLYSRCYFWAPSEETARDVISSFRFAPDRVRVVYPTGPQNQSAPRARPPSATLVALGVVRPYKALDEVVTAFATALKSVPDARLVIAGRRDDVEYEGRLQSLTRDLGIDASVAFEFNLTETAKSELLSRSAVLVLASRLEGYGIVSTEANATGAPVIASSGVPLAAVADGVNGLRYTYGDIPAMAACMVRLLSDEALYARLSRGAVEWSRDRTPDAMAGRFESLLRDAVGEPSIIPSVSVDAR